MSRAGRVRSRESVVAAALAGIAIAVPVQACAQERAGGGDWQQEVRYDIEARLDEAADHLRGRARVTYTNRSPETLDRLYFHQHLNAFRPNSIWARTERRPQYDFQALRDPDYGYERLLAARRLPAGAGGSDIVGRDLRPAYPLAPDSTVVELPLPVPLRPGDVVTLELDWEARPSTLCRRQCRSGRHYDFAQWYPRIAPYDREGWAEHPLYPQGEFYGEFATYDVVLDVEEDQVIGATGVPVAGDPGWADPDARLQRDWYDPPDPPRLGLLRRTPEPGRKRVRFYAEDVHHFAWSADPEYAYEGGEVTPSGDRERPIAVHVLYRPGDEESWGGGRAVERTVRALEFLEGVFGPYPWPQLTNLHRLEGGGTEFPMVIMDGSASEGLIVHETAHQWVHGIFANNEWKEAWLDEGFASFLTTLAFEDERPDAWRRARASNAGNERRGLSHPIATISEEFPDFATYGYMAYDRSEFVFYMLRRLVGDETFRGILREYYARHALRHVTEGDFRSTVADVSGMDLDWFFEQWLHSTATLDWRIDEVTVEETPEGWTTRVRVVRDGDAYMPVRLALLKDGETLSLESVTSRAREQTVELTSAERPTAVVLDPGGWLLDSNPDNDGRRIDPDG